MKGMNFYLQLHFGSTVQSEISLNFIQKSKHPSRWR